MANYGLPDHLRVSIGLEAENARLLSALGQALAATGAMVEAEAAYQRALEFEPDNLHALHSYGVLLKFLGRFDEAIEAYRKVLTISPRHRQARKALPLAD